MKSEGSRCFVDELIGAVSGCGVRYLMVEVVSGEFQS